MRSADEYTIEKLGVSEDILVERAGTALMEEITTRYKGGRVLIVIGKGNNGADGKVLARLLSNKHGFVVTVMDAFKDDLSVLDNDYDIIVDCIFGTGLKRAIDGKIADLINIINQKNCVKIACDIASGLDGNTGEISSVAVKADLTIAIGELKTGHFFNDGKEYSGKVVNKDIGISVWGEDYPLILDDHDIKEYFPKRKENTHKGSYGKCAIIGGSKEYFGAPLLSLSALSAYRVGVGYSYLTVPKSLYSIYAGLNPECVLTFLNDDGNNFILDTAELDKLFSLDAIAFGTGVGVTEGVHQTLKYIIQNYSGKLLIDADGLNALAKFGVGVLANKKCQIVLTPHIKEFSRLSKIEVSEILKNPISVTRDFAKEYGVTVVLKNAVSVITNGEETYINSTGTPALAKAGSGDLLTGLTAGLLATNDCISSAKIGAYLFGRAGELTAKELGEYSVTATEVSKNIGKIVLGL